MDTALLQALLSGAAVGGAYALVALGFSITFTTTKTLNFGQGEFVSAGAFVGASVLLISRGKPFSATSFSGADPSTLAQLGALLAAMLLMGLIGWLLYALGVRPFAGRPGMAWVMSTLGFGVILQSAGLAIWGPKPLVVPAPVDDKVIRLMGLGVRPQELLMLFVSLAVMLLFDYVMRRTAVGKAMRAVAHSSQVATLMGINVQAVMIGAFVVSTALAGLSGFMLAPVAQASLYLGFAVGLKGFSAAILGGLSSPRGCVAGGFLLGILESVINLWSAQWREVTIFALVIVALALRPTGLFGTRMVEKV